MVILKIGMNVIGLCLCVYFSQECIHIYKGLKAKTKQAKKKTLTDIV